MKSNVIPMATKPMTSFLDPHEEIDEEKIVSTIQHGLMEAYRAGAKLSTIAECTGLCVGTVSRYMYGETSFPRWHTTLMLAHFLGYRMVMIRGDHNG